jgi:hypothetical protein
MGNQRIIAAAVVAAAAAHTAVAHARGEISNQRIIAAAVVAAVAAPRRIKAHVRGQMMTREQMMTRWMNVREGGGGKSESGKETAHQEE